MTSDACRLQSQISLTGWNTDSNDDPANKPGIKRAQWRQPQRATPLAPPPWTSGPWAAQQMPASKCWLTNCLIIILKKNTRLDRNSLCTYNNGEFTSRIQQFLKVKRLPEAGYDDMTIWRLRLPACNSGRYVPPVAELLIIWAVLGFFLKSVSLQFHSDLVLGQSRKKHFFN